MKSALLLALLLAAPVLGALPSTDACAGATSAGPSAAEAPPCGKIYPTILITSSGAPAPAPLTRGATLDVPLTVVYRFDALNDGYSAVSPTDPVRVSFEFPRKPAWADLKVEPESFDVPVDDPSHFQPDPTANPPALVFESSQRIVVHVQLTGQAVLRDGFDDAKLLVFAKSTENGLYQAGYGIKEIRVRPEGALHESDVAGLRDRYSVSPLPALSLAPVSRAFGGTTVTVTPPQDAKFWESQPWNVKIDPAPAGRMIVAVHDEAGDLVAIRGPLESAAGATTLNVTLAKPGLHTVSVTLLPSTGVHAPPMTFALDIIAGDLKAEGYQYTKVYVVDASGSVPPPVGNTADTTTQWERDVPFFAFDTAQAVTALLTLTTPGAPDTVGRGLANIQFTLLDPDGNNLGQSSVDPTKPQWPIRVGSVPQDGWYTLRLRGVGLPSAAAYDARIEVDYATPPTARNRADGVADVTASTLSRGGRNMTLPLADLSVWNAGDITPKLDHAAGATFALTVTDLHGAPQYATSLRATKMSFTPPAPATFRAFVYADPATANAPFAPLVRAFTFDVGAGRPVVAQRFAIEDAPLAPTTAPSQEALVAIYAIPAAASGGKGDGSAAGGRVELVDAQGKKAEPGASGPSWLDAYATNTGPERTMAVKYALDLPAAVTIEPVGGAVPAKAATGGSKIPGIGVAGLAAATAAALTFFFARRRT